MQRITITIDDDLLQTVDDLMKQQGYESRSEVLRDVIRGFAAKDRLSIPNTQCIGTLTHVFEYGIRALALRVAQTHHAHHNMIVASTQVYLDHDSSLEVSVLRGESADVRKFAESLSSQRGVRHSNLHLMPVKVETTEHNHGTGSMPHEHLHM